MAGGGGTNSTVGSFYADPQTQQQALAAGQRVVGDAANFRGAADQAANAFQTNFMQNAPQLNSNFAGPNFNSGLDSFSQNILSQGHADQANRLAAQQAQIGRKFQNNGALANVLRQQAATQSQLGTNPLLFQAATAQRAREGQEYQLGQQAQSLSNSTRLAQTQANAGLQGLQNAALGQQLQLRQAPTLADQNLLSILAQAATIGGTGKAVNAVANGSVNLPGQNMQRWDPFQEKWY